ncbi:uncharacterized protein AB9X84_010057 isoform 2-T2 [Acanthopagrus schlegelii]
MSGCLLFLLMYTFHEIQAQALLPPELTVNRLEITETDSVTLKCQAPSSVFVSECGFLTLSGGIVRGSSCMRTLMGIELLKMSRQSATVEVKVSCYYTVKLEEKTSPDSNPVSITIQDSPPPKLRVNPPLITETDSVTLDCQTPPSVFGSQCYFFTLSAVNVREFSCQKTLTGTELLKMSSHSSPAEVKIKCFYMLKLEVIDFSSLHSETASINIRTQNQKPQMSLQHFPGEYVLFTCSLPGPVNHDTRCNLYFGEKSNPVSRTTIWSKRAMKTNQWFCLFTVTTDDLLRRLRSVQQSDASCDYSLGSEPKSLSARSERYGLTDIVEKESSMIQTTPTLRMTTGQTGTPPPVKPTSAWPVDRPSHTGGSISTSQTPVNPPPVNPTPVNPKPVNPKPVNPESDTSMKPMNPESGDERTEGWILKFAAVAAGCGVTVGVVLLISAICCNRKRAGWSAVRSHHTGGLSSNSQSTPVKPASAAGCEEVKITEPRHENYETYHIYDTIPEPP